MTRAEVAALTMALHVLRRDVLGDDESKTWAARDRLGAAFDVEAFARPVGPWPTEPCRTAWIVSASHHYRVVRARLALYLRTLLRAERGDVGRWTCPDHPGATVATDQRDDGSREWWCSRERRWQAVTPESRPVRAASIARPLWLDAPPWRDG